MLTNNIDYLIVSENRRPRGLGLDEHLVVQLVQPEPVEAVLVAPPVQCEYDQPHQLAGPLYGSRSALPDQLPLQVLARRLRFCSERLELAVVHGVVLLDLVSRKVEYE